jgi:site-specific DNA-cytosine methylase
VYAKGRRAQSVNDHETWLDATNGVSPTLNQFDTGDTRATTAVVNSTWWDGGDVSQTLDRVLDKYQCLPEKGRFPCVLQGEPGGPTIRRLTPLECERLQGFPDAWTAADGSGASLSDAARYRALGNAVCVPVASWLGCRIVAGEKLRTAI